MDLLCSQCAQFTPIKASVKSVAPSAIVKPAKAALPSKTSLGSEGSNNEPPTEEEQEMQRYLESRSKLMQKLLIVLFWSILYKLNQTGLLGLLRVSLETISYYSKEVLQYLVACDRDSCGSWIVHVSDLSLGLPMAVHTNESLQSLSGVDGKSIRVSVHLSFIVH